MSMVNRLILSVTIPFYSMSSFAAGGIPTSPLKCHTLFSKFDPRLTPSTRVEATIASRSPDVIDTTPASPIHHQVPADPWFPPAHAHQKAEPAQTHAMASAAAALDGSTNGMSIPAQAKATAKLAQNDEPANIATTPRAKNIRTASQGARAHAATAETFPVTHTRQSLLAAQTRTTNQASTQAASPVKTAGRVHPSFGANSKNGPQPLTEAGIGTHAVESLGDALSSKISFSASAGEHHFNRNALVFVDAHDNPSIMLLSNQTNPDLAAKNLLGENSSWSLIAVTTLDIGIQTNHKGLISQVILTTPQSTIGASALSPVDGHAVEALKHVSVLDHLQRYFSTHPWLRSQLDSKVAFEFVELSTLETPSKNNFSPKPAG